MEEITPTERGNLREYFRANAVPTQDQFWQFIESTLNSVEDGLSKTRGTALRIRPSTTPGSQSLELFKTQSGTTMAWTIEVVPQLQGIDRPGLHFFQPGHTGTLYLRESDGAIGMGTLTPNGRLHVMSTSPDSWRHDELFGSITLNVGSEGQGKPGTIKLQGSTLTDFAFLRQAQGAMMIDSSTGEFYFNRDNGVRQFVGGVQPATVLHIMNGEQQEAIRLHAGGNSFFQSGQLGIGTDNPLAALHVQANSEARVEALGSGSVIIGAAESVHLAIDSDAILAKSSGTTPGTLHLQPQGGLLHVGGEVHIEGNLELDQSLVLHRDLTVEAELRVQGGSHLAQVEMTGDLNVLGTANMPSVFIHNNLNVNGLAWMQRAVLNDTLDVNGLAQLTGVRISGLLHVLAPTVMNEATLNSYLTVHGPTTLSHTVINESLTVTSPASLANTSINGNLNVSAQTDLNHAHLLGNMTVDGSSNLVDANLNGQLNVAGQSNLHNTTVTGLLNVSQQSNLKNTLVDGTLSTNGHSNLKNTTVDGVLSTTGQSNLRNTQVTGTLAVTAQSNLKNTVVDGSLGVNGQSNIKNTLVDGFLVVNGLSTLGLASMQGLDVAGEIEMGSAHILGDLQVNTHTSIGGNLNVQGTASAFSLSAIDHIGTNGRVTANELQINLNSVLGDVVANNQLINNELRVVGLSNLNQVLADRYHGNSMILNGDVQADSLNVNHLNVNTHLNLTSADFNGQINVLGDANLRDTNVQGRLRVFGFTEMTEVNVGGQLMVNGPLVVSGPFNAQWGQFQGISANDLDVHNLTVHGIMNYPGMNVNGPGNFNMLNIDGALTFMQGMYRIDAAAAEMHIGSNQSPDAITILPTGQLRLNMGGSWNVPWTQSDLVMKGRMDITDGNLGIYDPTSMLDGGNFKAELCITGRRSRLAIASDIYNSPEPGSTLEFAAIDGGQNSAFVFSIEQLRNNNNFFPNNGMPGTKLGFYLWHREHEWDRAYDPMMGGETARRIPFTIDGAKFKVGVGTSTPYTRFDILGKPNLQQLQMLLMESEIGPLEMEYSGGMNNFPIAGNIGGASIGFSSEITNGLPGPGPWGPMPQDGTVPNLYGKIGLHRNPNTTPIGMPVPIGMPENSGIEISTYYDLPIHMRISDQTMVSINKELQHALVIIGKPQEEPSRLEVHGQAEVYGQMEVHGQVEVHGDLYIDKPFLNRGYGTVTVGGAANSFVPVWFKETDPDNSLLEVEFFAQGPNTPTVMRFMSFFYDPSQGPQAGIVMVDTLHANTANCFGDATLRSGGFRVIWLRGGHTYRWRSNKGVIMNDLGNVPPGNLSPIPTPHQDVQVMVNQGRLFRQVS